MSIVVIEDVFAAEKITFLKRSERLNMLFRWQSPPGSITDCWQSPSVFNCYEMHRVCVWVCVTSNQEHHQSPPLTTLILIPKMMSYKLQLVSGIFFCVCVSYVSPGVMAVQECASQCVSSPAGPSCGGPAAPAIRPSTDTLTRPALAQVSPLTSPLSCFKIGSFVCCFLQVIVRSAS